MRPVGVEKNKISFVADWIFVWAFLAALGLYADSAFSVGLGVVRVVLPQGAAALGVMAFMSAPIRLSGRVRALIWLAGCAAIAIFTNGFWLGGIRGLGNLVIDAFGKNHAYQWPYYGTGLEGDAQSAAIYFAALWFCALGAIFALYAIRAGFWFVVAIFMAAMPIVAIFAGIAPSGWVLLVSECLLAATLIRTRGALTGGSGGHMAFLQVSCLVAVFAIVIPLVSSAIMGQTGLALIQPVSDMKEAIEDSISEARYGGSSDILPNGDFRGLGNFEPESGKNVLTVTMSRPDSYYLRGFVGGTYEKTGWTTTDESVLWESRDLFYWLHDDGFYGQQMLSLAAAAMEPEQAQETNEITISNTAGSSEYILTPYEMYQTTEYDGAFSLDSQKIGDEGISASGITGARDYTYTSLSNQVVNYPQYLTALLDTSNLTQEQLAYRELEGYYNEFAYNTYLDVPDEIMNTLTGLFGTVQIEDGKKHADYADAKDAILYVLTSEDYTQSNELLAEWDGANFITDFLNVTKTGYSVHYASAAVMMFRYYGIPARYVEGYLITPEDASAMEAGVPYTVDETHAHAWVEYYQDGVGWLPFEVTPSYLNVMRQAQDYQDISGLDASGANDGAQSQEEPTQEDENSTEDEIDWILVAMVLLIIAICVLALILIIMLIRILRERARCRKIRGLFGSPDNNIAVAAMFEHCINILSAAGMNIRNCSLFDYEDDIGGAYDAALAAHYTRAAAIRQAAVYGTAQVGGGQRADVKEFMGALWQRIYDNGTALDRIRLKLIYFL